MSGDFEKLTANMAPINLEEEAGTRLDLVNEEF